LEPPFVLGIDAGGTKTVCYLADGTGRVLGESRGEGANLQALGELDIEKVLHGVMDRALVGYAVVPSAICLGMAGVDRAEDAAVVQGIMRRIGYKARVVVTNDALVALVAGAAHDPGIVVVAGTGSIAYGRNARNVAARAGGWGYVLGDEGSGYWIGRLALRAVVRQADGRGRRTSLTPRILAHYGVARPSDLVRHIYGGHPKPSAIASLARYVQEAHDEDDAIASGILETGVRELLGCAASVTTQLQMNDDAFVFVLAGGIFEAVPWLADTLAERLTEIAPHGRAMRLDREPAWGAIQIALSEARGERRIPAYESS
jgi:N-acetylglucosamine kinase-like BadF-type ATPase